MDSAPSASCGISKMQVDVWTLDPCLLVASHHRCISLVSIQDLSHSKSSATEPCLTTLFNFHFQLDTLREKDFDGFQMCIWNLECNACYMTLQHAAMCECSPHILGLSPWIVRWHVAQGPHPEPWPARQRPGILLPAKWRTKVATPQCTWINCCPKWKYSHPTILEHSGPNRPKKNSIFFSIRTGPKRQCTNMHQHCANSRPICTRACINALETSGVHSNRASTEVHCILVIGLG